MAPARPRIARPRAESLTNVSPAGAIGTYRRQDPVARRAMGTTSEGAAHQKWLKTERLYLAMVRERARNGDTEILMRMRMRVAAVELTERQRRANIAPCVTTQLRDVHQADQRGAAARFSYALDGMRPNQEESLLRATCHEIEQLKELVQALEARKAAR